MKIKLHMKVDWIPNLSPVAFVHGPFLGVEKPYMLRPRPDPKNLVNLASSASHRFATAMPEGNNKVRGEFLKFSKLFIKIYFPVLDSNTVVSFDEWIRSSGYTQAEKLKFQTLISEKTNLTERDLYNKSFIKWESYGEYKYPRSINAYTDLCKAYCGPMQHVLDKAIYGLKWSVKGRDVSYRPGELKELFGDGPVSATDFTSFEAHHRGEFAALRLFWKRHVGRFVQGFDEYYKIIEAKSFGRNVSKFKGVTVTVNERLMSGDASTSSDNFVLDLCLIMFMAARTKYSHLTRLEQVRMVGDNFKARFEGDDGIFERLDIPQDLIDGLGLRFKKADFPHYSLASFCGIVSEPNSLINTTDPVKVLSDFTVLNIKYVNFSDKKKLDLLRARALSYAYLYRDCPIIAPYVHYVLRMTAGRDIRWTLKEEDSYSRWILEQALAKESWKHPPSIGWESRQFVSDVYGIPIEEQIAFEKKLENKCDLGPIDHKFKCHRDLEDFADYFCYQGTPPTYPISIDLDTRYIVTRTCNTERDRKSVV